VTNIFTELVDHRQCKASVVITSDLWLHWSWAWMSAWYALPHSTSQSVAASNHNLLVLVLHDCGAVFCRGWGWKSIYRSYIADSVWHFSLCVSCAVVCSSRTWRRQSCYRNATRVSWMPNLSILWRCAMYSGFGVNQSLSVAGRTANETEAVQLASVCLSVNQGVGNYNRWT